MSASLSHRVGSEEEEEWENAPLSPVLYTKTAGLTLTQTNEEQLQNVPPPAPPDVTDGGNPLITTAEVPSSPLDLIERLYKTAGCVRVKDLLFLFDRTSLCHLLAMHGGKPTSQSTSLQIAEKLVVLLNRQREQCVRAEERAKRLAQRTAKKQAHSVSYEDGDHRDSDYIERKTNKTNVNKKKKLSTREENKKTKANNPSLNISKPPTSSIARKSSGTKKTPAGDEKKIAATHDTTTAIAPMKEPDTSRTKTVVVSSVAVHPVEEVKDATPAANTNRIVSSGEDFDALLHQVRTENISQRETTTVEPRKGIVPAKERHSEMNEESESLSSMSDPIHENSCFSKTPTPNPIVASVTAPVPSPVAAAPTVVPVATSVTVPVTATEVVATQTPKPAPTKTILVPKKAPPAKLLAAQQSSQVVEPKPIKAVVSQSKPNEKKSSSQKIAGKPIVMGALNQSFQMDASKRSAPTAAPKTSLLENRAPPAPPVQRVTIVGAETTKLWTEEIDDSLRDQLSMADKAEVDDSLHKSKTNVFNPISTSDGVTLFATDPAMWINAENGEPPSSSITRTMDDADLSIELTGQLTLHDEDALWTKLLEMLHAEPPPLLQEKKKKVQEGLTSS